MTNAPSDSAVAATAWTHSITCPTFKGAATLRHRPFDQQVRPLLGLALMSGSTLVFGWSSSAIVLDAGRTEPGVAYRLWSKIEHGSRPRHRRRLDGQRDQVLARAGQPSRVVPLPGALLSWSAPPRILRL